MKVLITGATGFVGKTLVPFLASHGYTDLCLVIRNRGKADRLFGCLPLKYIDNTVDGWEEQVISYNPDAVIHLATLFTSKKDAQTAKQVDETNILFTTLLVEALSHTDCRYFINAGTFTEFLHGSGEYFPNNLYSASKTAVRPIIQYYQTQGKWQWFNVVIYSPYGRWNEHKKVIDYMADALDAPAPVKFSEGKQILDFTHVDDMADFFCTLLNKASSIDKTFCQFHLGTGKGHTLREVGAIMERQSGKTLNAIWGGIPYRPLDAMQAVAPIALNIELLNWRSRITLEEGISIYLADIGRQNSGGGAIS